MVTKLVRAHVVLPAEVLEEIDQRAGRRHRSEYIAEVLTEDLKRRRRAELARKMAGSLAGPGKHIPEWDTPESTDRWLRELRRDWHDPWQEAAAEES